MGNDGVSCGRPMGHTPSTTLAMPRWLLFRPTFGQLNETMHAYSIHADCLHSLTKNLFTVRPMTLG